MQTYFKNNSVDWFYYKDVTRTIGADISFLNNIILKGTVVTESVLDNAPSDIKLLLDNKMVSVLTDIPSNDIIDITAHIDNNNIFGIVNYFKNKTQSQLRF
jgi:hypothetical protein